MTYVVFLYYCTAYVNEIISDKGEVTKEHSLQGEDSSIGYIEAVHQW